MATYRIYKDGITRIDEEYDPTNPYGSDSQDPAGRTYYCGSGQNAFSKVVDEAGYDENVKDTFVFMEEGSWRVPIVYERRFGLYKSISADNYARPFGVRSIDVKYNHRPVIYEIIPGWINYDATFEQIAPDGPGIGGLTSIYFNGSYPLQVSVKGGEYKTVRGFDVDLTGANVASDYKFRVRYGQRTRNMDLLVRPGLEGGKVRLVFRSQTDDTDGFDGVESSYGLGMPGNEKTMLTRSGTSCQSWAFIYGIYLPFDRVYGVSFVSGGAGSLASTTKKKTWRVPGVFLDASFEKTIVYGGWWASPREIDSCIVTGLSLDLWLTERITRTTFNSCPSTILPVREHGLANASFNAFRMTYGWARLSDPRIPDFTDKSSYSVIGGKDINSSFIGDTTKRFRIVDSCKFYSCTAADDALVYAALVINCVFKNNTCAFPVAGFATNCAFVENSISLGEVVEHYTNRAWGGESHALDFGGWSGHIYDIAKVLQYRMSQGLITNSYLVKNTIAENERPTFMVRNIETVHDQCIYRRYCIYDCVFDQIKTGGVLAVYACDEDETLVDKLDSDGIIRPEESQYLLLRGRPSAAVFSEIDGRLKVQDPGFAGIDSLQMRDLYGKPRQYFDAGCISIGPVSENIDSSFSVVRASCASGLGKVYPSVQVCKKGSECTVQVDSYSSVDYVKINGNSIAPSKRIRIVPSERFIDVEVGTKFAVGLSTTSYGADIEKRVAADGTDTRPFACLQDTFKYIATRVGGSVPISMNSYSNDAYTYAGSDNCPAYIFNVDSRNIEGLSYSLLDQRTIKNTCGRIEVHVFGGGLLDNRPNFIGDKRLIKYGNSDHYSFNNKPIVCYFDDRTDVDYIEEPVAGSVPVYYAMVAGSTLYSGYVGGGCYINFDTVLPDFDDHDSVRGGSFVNCRLRGYDCAVGGTKALACDIDARRNFYKMNESTKRFNGTYRMEFDSCSIDDGRASPDGLALKTYDKIIEGKMNVVAESVKGCRINGLRVESIEKSYVTNTETTPVSFRYSTFQPVTTQPGNTLVGWAMPDVVAYRRDTKFKKNTESYLDRDLAEIVSIAAGKDAADPIISRQACDIFQDVTGIAVQDLRSGYSDALTFITLYGYSSFNDSDSNLLVGRYSFDTRLDTLRKYHAFLVDKMSTVCGKKTYKSLTRKKKTMTTVSPTGAVSTRTSYSSVLGSFEIDIFNVFKDHPGSFVPVSPSGAEAASLSEENLLAFRTECAQNSVFVSNGKDVCMPVFFSDDLFKSIVHNNLSDDDTGFRKRLIVADDGRRFYGELVREASGDAKVDSCTYVRSVFEFLNDSRLELEQFTEKNTGRRCIGIDFDWFENFIGS